MSKRDWNHVWQLFKDVFRFEKRTVVYCILAAALTAVKPYFYMITLGKMIDMVYIEKELAQTFAFVVFMLTLSHVLELVRSFAQEKFDQKMEKPQEFCVFPLNEKALTMDYEYLEDTHVQELRFRSFTKSYYGIGGWLTQNLNGVTQAVVSIIISIVIIFPMLFNSETVKDGFVNSGYFTLLLLGIMLVISYFTYKSGIVFTRKSKEILDSYDEPYNKKHYYLDLFSGIEVQKDIRINRYEQVLEKDVDGLFTELRECERKQGILMVYRKIMEQSAVKLSAVLIYLFTALRAYAGIITIGNVVTYASSIIQFSRSMGLFAAQMGHVKSLAQYAADYYEFISLEKKKYAGTIPVEKRRDNKFQVEFEHVSFKYPGSDEYVIKDLNLSFVIGEKMAIVGKNGSGKTTFIKLLCRLYDVTEGCIKLNGIDIRKYDYKEYCQLFAAVFQDFSIFSFPLGENIAACESVDEEKAMEALRKAGLGERMQTLPDGLNTYVGKEFHNNGVAFSGGEKQKMAIARAIYKDSPFVIMDEPTAALDPEAEYAVYAGFDKMVGNKTALYISHRLASCRFCEDILVFDKGQVVQRGSHELLEKQDGLYQKLWNAQAQYYG